MVEAYHKAMHKYYRDRNMYLATKIPDQKESREMKKPPRKSNGPCQEQNHKALEAILIVPSTLKCESHIQILENAS